MNEEKSVFRTDIKDGLRDCVPIIFAATPVGAIFGAAAISAGFSWQEAMLASLAMYAGASQFVLLELYGFNLPAWSVLLAIFAVNFRHILYSASLANKFGSFSFIQKFTGLFLLTDPQWAVSETRHEKQGLRPAYYFSYGLLLYALWIAATAIGVIFGSLLEDPSAYGFDFILPLYFLTILVGFRSRRKFYPIVIISGIASYALYLLIGPPWHISLGALCGVFAAALMPVSDEKGEVSK